MWLWSSPFQDGSSHFSPQRWQMWLRAPPPLGLPLPQFKSGGCACGAQVLQGEAGEEFASLRKQITASSPCLQGLILDPCK